MARFSIRQMLALTALCAVWLATFSPEVFGIFAHIALGWLLVIGFLAWNRYSIGFLSRAAHAFSFAATAISSLLLLLFIAIIFQSDTSRADHLKWSSECVSWLGMLISTFAAANWVRRRSRNPDSTRSQRRFSVRVAAILFGGILAYLLLKSPREPVEILRIVLLNAAYFIAYARTTSQNDSNG